MRNINSPDELLAEAQWFDLSNYDICSELSPKQWAALLSLERVASLAPYWRDHPEINLVSIAANILVKSFRDLQLQALKTPSKIAALEKNITNHVQASPLRALANPLGVVRPLTWKKAQRKPNHIPEGSDSLCFDEVVEHYETAQITVDLTARDSVLKESFMELVGKYRQHFGIPNPKPCNRNNFESLSEYKVLPYLHLKHWAAAEGIEIKPRVYSWVLYGGQRGERSITETLAPLAGRSLEPGFISGLLELDKEASRAQPSQP